MNNTEALMVLNAVGGLGSAGMHKLIECYGSPSDIFNVTASQLLASRIIPDTILQKIIDFPREHFLQTEYEQMAKRQARVITYLDNDYPALLREMAGAPYVLYVRGQLPPDSALSVAMVGSRQASYYGLTTANKFAMQLSELGFTIVSGMARGIDTEAHKGALKAGGPTVAVLGCGLAHIYPPENTDLFDRITRAGAVLSEFPMSTPPLPYNFPRRNRIISGLSVGVIIVEAAQRSGALITADFALEQGREVFAVPGRIDSMTAQGVHDLIKQGAKLVTCIEDVLEDLQQKCSAHLDKPTHAPEGDPSVMGNRWAEGVRKDLSEEEQIVFNQIADRPVHVDELIHTCGAAVPVMSILLKLELKKVVQQLPGKLFTHRQTQ
jgi:DNA processing protein